LGTTLLLVRLLLFGRGLDSRTHALILRATVQVASEKKQTHEQERGPGFLAGRQSWPLAAELELGLALATCIAVEEAMHGGRCGIDADSRVAPQPDPRARRQHGGSSRRSRKKQKLAPLLKCDVVGAAR